jgi:hypothetical protein
MYTGSRIIALYLKMIMTYEILRCIIARTTRNFGIGHNSWSNESLLTTVRNEYHYLMRYLIRAEKKLLLDKSVKMEVEVQ